MPSNMVVEISTVSGKLKSKIPRFILRSNPRRNGGVVSLMKAVACRASAGCIAATGLPFMSAMEDDSMLRKAVSALVKSCSSRLIALRSSTVRMIVI